MSEMLCCRFGSCDQTHASMEQATLASGPVISAPGAGGQLIAEAASKRFGSVARHVALFGFPPHVEEAIRRNSKWVQLLDPDIAAKRSWSMSVKILTQQERNYQREIERMRELGWFEMAQEKFKNLVGFEWPY